MTQEKKKKDHTQKKKKEEYVLYICQNCVFMSDKHKDV